jgi:hypothetical protein
MVLRVSGIIEVQAQVGMGKNRKILAELRCSEGKYLSTGYFCGPEACFRLELTVGAGAWASAVSMVW